MRRALPDAAAIAGTVLIAAAAWLFLPRERAEIDEDTPARRIVLVDTSASAMLRREHWSEWVRKTLQDQQESARRAGEELQVVLFGDEVRRIEGTELPRIAGNATRLADALGVARELVRGRDRVVIVGDGTYTGEDPRPAMKRLADAGATIEGLDLPPPDVEEIVAGPLDVPEEVEVGAPIAASFDVFYAPGRKPPASTIPLRVNDRTVDVAVPAGREEDEDGYFRWRARVEVGRAEPGWNRVLVADRLAFVRGAGERLVGLVTAMADPASSSASWFSPIPSEDGVQVVIGVPWEILPAIERFDAIVTVDIPPSDLPLPILRSFVERGGGWFAWIGDESRRSFVSGDAADLLPLLPHDDDAPPRDVVLLVDRSGSMSGDRTENVRRAAFALLDEAPRSDSIELRWFAQELSRPIHLVGPADSRRPADREEARRRASDALFATETGGGPTALLGSLAELADARAAAGRESIVFLLTDGLENVDPDPATTAGKLSDRLRATRTKLVVITASAQSDRGLLLRLVEPGAELFEVAPLLDDSSGESLRVLFRRELTRDAMREGPDLRVLPGSPESELASGILQAMGSDRARDWPTIPRYLRSKAAPESDVLCVSQYGEPVLALQRVGLGTTAASAFVPADFGKLLGPLVRAMARGNRGPRPRLRVEGGDLVLAGLPENAPAELEARVFGADADSDAPVAVFALWPTIEGDPGRLRRGRLPELGELWDVRAPWARVPRVEIRAPETAASAWTPLQLAFAPRDRIEFVLPRPRIPPLDRTGAGEIASTLLGRPAQHPAAPWVLISGMLLLTGAGLAGSFTRRVR